MRFSIAIPAALAAITLCASFASADDMGKSAPAAKERVRILVLGGDAARFEVERDAAAGRMTFHLADETTKLDGAPVIVMASDTGPKEITLTAVEGRPGTWSWTNDAVKALTFEGSMRVIVAGKRYTAPLSTVWVGEAATDGWAKEPVPAKARHGGRILLLQNCGASVEILQDLKTGTVTVYGCERMVVTEAPVITVTESEGPASVTLTRVVGEDGAWTMKHEAFKTKTSIARIQVVVDGKSCEVPLVYGASRGGQVVTVADGPSFELVRDAKTGTYTFYALDETIDGKAYTVENPKVVHGGKTYDLVRVEGEPRAWRLVGLDGKGSDSRDGQLNFTLFGKTLSTRVGLSGFGVDVK